MERKLTDIDISKHQEQYVPISEYYPAGQPEITASQSP